MPIKQQAIFQMEIKMITGFNKKELRLFEKYRKQWNKFEECNFGLFIHEINSKYVSKLINPDKKLLKKNLILMRKNSRPLKSGIISNRKFKYIFNSK